MAKLISKKSLKWLLPAAIGVAVAVGVFAWWRGKQNALPPGIVSGNGRVEGTLVDISSKAPHKVEEVLVQEGDLVRPGLVVARCDTTTLESELDEAKAAQAAEEERLAVAEANIVKQKSQISLAGIEVKRSQALVKQGAGSQRELDVHDSELATTKAQLGEAAASLNTAKQRIVEAKQGLERFARALEALPPAQREAFLLHEEADMNAAEIARATGTNEEAAKSRLRYAIAKLKQAIADD